VIITDPSQLPSSNAPPLILPVALIRELVCWDKSSGRYLLDLCGNYVWQSGAAFGRAWVQLRNP
jgi:hypothetical protein